MSARARSSWLWVALLSAHSACSSSNATTDGKGSATVGGGAGLGAGGKGDASGASGRAGTSGGALGTVGGAGGAMSGAGAPSGAGGVLSGAGGAPASGGTSAAAGQAGGGAAFGGGGGRAGRNGSGGAETGGMGAAGRAAGGDSGMAGGAGQGGCSSGPVGTLSGALADGIRFMDTDGKAVNAHGGGVIRVGNTYYLHGELFLDNTTDNDFHGFSMYSSQDLATWKNEGVILPTQASGELGPTRKGERPHIIQCPSTGEFVLYAHAASEDYQMDKEVVYATSATVNGQYAYRGPLTNSSGTTASHSDMSALTDGDNAYVVTESGHVFTLASDCHSWVSDNAYSAVNGDSGGSESPTVFKAGSTYYWIGSYKTGWRANNNFYSTAPAMKGPWTYQGFVAPVADKSDDLSDERTWLSQSTWVTPVAGCQGTVYVYWGDHWDGNLDTTAPGRHNYLTTYVFQPLVFDGTAISMPTYHQTWKLDAGLGTWSE